MNSTLLLTTMVLAACFGLGTSTARAEISDADKAFLDTMAASDMAEIELSRVATSQSLSPQVRDFAQTIASDHGANYQALLTLCSDKKYAIAHASMQRTARSCAGSAVRIRRRLPIARIWMR